MRVVRPGPDREVDVRTTLCALIVQLELIARATLAAQKYGTDIEPTSSSQALRIISISTIDSVSHPAKTYRGWYCRRPLEILGPSRLDVFRLGVFQLDVLRRLP